MTSIDRRGLLAGSLAAVTTAAADGVLAGNTTLAAAGAVRSASAAQRAPGSALLTRRIPSTGESLPVIGLGTSGPFEVGAAPADRAGPQEVLDTFFGAGATLIDTSPMYTTAEAVLGDLLTPTMQRQAFIATKVWTRGGAEGIAQMMRSMQLMKRENVELMQVHNLLDLDAHLGTLRDWKRAGRIRYLGITHYTVASHTDLANVIKREKPDFVQFNYSASTPDAENTLLPLCADLGVATLINRAFDDGKLFERLRGRPLPPFAADIDCTSWGQVLLKYVISHPAVTCVIPATGKRRNMLDNLAAGRGRLPDAKQRQAIVDAVR
jgi:aryl-alcohol dehydrogenase-like predicted oxidoreductase